MPIQLVAKNFIPELPDEFKCPLCGAKVCFEVSDWAKDEFGYYTNLVTIDCTTEPEIFDAPEEWKIWHKWHWSSPYIDWIPIIAKVERWLKDNYRFDLDGRTPEEELQALADWNAGRPRILGSES